MKRFKSGALPLLAAVLLMGCTEADDDGMWRGRTEVVAWRFKGHQRRPGPARTRSNG